MSMWMTWPEAMHVAAKASARHGGHRYYVRGRRVRPGTWLYCVMWKRP